MLRAFTLISPLLGVFAGVLLAVAPAQALEVRAVPLFTGVEQPTSLADDGTERLFITEQEGRIRVAVQERLRREPYLDITQVVKSGGERGLLCVVFHPQFATNGRFFVNYTSKRSGKLETIVSEFHASPASLKADAAGEKILLRFPQPYSNHNGGQLAFGPDGMLYIAIGDGGSANDPLNAGQDLSTWLGKILRIDVSTPGRYRVPEGNPFVGREGAKPEIWAWGLRNPWRFSFDRKTGQLWAADVGQNKWEEVNLVEKGGNYGWSAREAAHDFKPERAAPPPVKLIDPIKEYGREEGHSVTGGYVYRGTLYPELEGLYIYGDYVTRRVWGLRCEGPGKPVTFDQQLATLPFNISAFGEDHRGELYVLDHSEGRVHKLAPVAP